MKRIEVLIDELLTRYRNEKDPSRRACYLTEIEAARQVLEALEAISRR